MTAPRILFYVQHLLGIGHLMRAARLARALAAAGIEVDLVSGGAPPPGLELGGARLVELPSARSRDESFAELVDAAGRPVDDAWRAARRERLLGLFRSRRPDGLIFEMFPFGRRQMHFELLPLLEAALAETPQPLIVASVRDIVQRRTPERDEETLALVTRAFDLVLVHGDPALVRFEESFPLAHRLGGRLHYTGYLAGPPAPRSAAGGAGLGEVVVSAGGGAVGQALFAATLAARPLTRLAQAPWRLLVGHQISGPAFAAFRNQAPTGVTVERTRPDFREILAKCRISVSQAGYNTVMDILAAQARAVLIPFAGHGESEQSLRAERLAARGRAQLVPEAELGPARLAAAIDAADLMPVPGADGIDLAGVAASVRLIAARLSTRRLAIERAG